MPSAARASLNAAARAGSPGPGSVGRRYQMPWPSSSTTCSV